MRKLLLTITTTLLCLVCFSQNSVSFLMKDARSGEPLENVSVTIKGTTIGIVSDSAGRVLLKKIPEGKQLVIISTVGYKDVALNLFFPLQNETKVFEIQLEPLFSPE